MHYWQSRNREGTTGPYAEEQLRGMWANGLVVGDNHICAIGQFHDWMSLSILMDAFEEQKSNDAGHRKNVDLRLALASRKYDRQNKSMTIALAMSGFLPMGASVILKNGSRLSWGGLSA